MGTKARIRGLDQNAVTLNDDVFLSGLELYTQGEGNTREADSLEGIPSELLGGIDVYKTPTAALSESGLGGIINLKTRDAFDLPGTTLAGNIRYADSGEGWEPLGALVLGHEFNDRFAVIASVSYDKQNFQTDVLGGDNRGDWDFSDRSDVGTVPQNYFAPEYRYATDRDEERERFGATLGVTFRPSESTEISAQWFHSDLDIVTEEGSIKFPFAYRRSGHRDERSERAGSDVPVRSRRERRAAARHGAREFGRGDLVRQEHRDHFGQLPAQVQVGQRRCMACQRQRRLFEGRSGKHQRQQRRALHAVLSCAARTVSASRRTRARRRTIGSRTTTTAARCPRFALVGNQDLYTNPNNGFFKSHWVFGDTTEAENWAVRADVEFTPQFIEAGNVTFSGGLRLANRQIDYDFGRYLADYSGSGELDGSQFGQNWTPLGYFQDGAIGFKACEIPASAGANFQFAPCEPVRQFARADHAVPDLHRQRFGASRPSTASLTRAPPAPTACSCRTARR